MTCPKTKIVIGTKKIINLLVAKGKKTLIGIKKIEIIPTENHSLYSSFSLKKSLKYINIKKERAIRANLKYTPLGIIGYV